MDISKQRSRCIKALRANPRVPQDLTQTLENASIPQYLDIVAELALQPWLTEVMFAAHGNVFVAISSRWLIRLHEEQDAKLAAYARILPCASYLTIHLATLLDARGRAFFQEASSGQIANLLYMPAAELTDLLLCILRLLRYDYRTYSVYLSPTYLVALLEHEQNHIRFLTVRILAMLLNASDLGLSRLLDSHVRVSEINGPWEGKVIDYSWYTLWEHSRLEQLKHSMRSMEDASEPCLGHVECQLSHVHLSGTSAIFGNVLLPISQRPKLKRSHFIWTKTTKHNMERIALGVTTPRSLLVMGAPGSGKSASIREVADITGNGTFIVTLHINDQVDTKMLLGTYATDTSDGRFSWQPGVLTRAVTEGRWVVIEDIDRAPLEFLSMLRSVLEKRELFMPNSDTVVRCAPGFRLFGTSSNMTLRRGPDKASTTSLIDVNDWHLVELEDHESKDIEQILLELFPTVRAVLPALMLIYSDLTGLPQLRPRRARRARLNSLLRLCRRIHQDLHDQGCTTGFEPIATTTDHQSFLNQAIFLHTVDCFVGHLPAGQAKDQATDIIGKALNISPELAKHVLTARRPSHTVSEHAVQIGRARLVVSASKTRPPTAHLASSSNFALTDHFLRLLESLMTSVKFSEPCLLVGETGTGKTSLVQYLAKLLDRKLEVLNLSQQSETGDILGSLKPVNIQSLAIPMKDEFENLLHLTFPTGQNQKYLEAQTKAVLQQRWERLLDLWKAACQRIRPIIDKHLSATLEALQEPNKKRRKLRIDYQELKSRWSRFEDQSEIFRVQFSKGNDGFAFTFVESRLVRALRNGDWVLLDEMNLASPETLDTLADLFDSAPDSPPSLLLPEGGRTERIYGHTNFRIFGAMNPPTDIGKKDLPSAIVSRFTEIFFEPPDKNLVDLEAVVRTNLGQHCHHDTHIASDLGQIYLEVAKSVGDNSIVDGSNQKPHLSLRTFSRALLYTADMFPWYGLRRAAFEGFSMCLLAELDGASSERVVSIIVKRLYGSMKSMQLAKRTPPRLPKDGHNYLVFEQYWLLKGSLVQQTQPEYILTSYVRRNLLNLVRAASTRRFPVLLQGPTSSGKTSMVQYLARLSGNKFVRINNHEHTDLQEYLGTYTSDANGQLHYQDGVLVRALREGHWIVLDELNLAPSDVLEALNRLLDDNRELLIPETQEIVLPHRNFMLFATQNPPGLYGGRKHLSRAFKNRFLCLHFGEIPDDELEQILRERAQIAPSFCANIVSVYKKLAAHRQTSRLFEQRHSFATLRDLFRWASRSASSRQLLAEEGFMLLGERVRDSIERSVVQRCIEETMNVQIDPANLYGLDRCKTLLTQSPTQVAGIQWTGAMRRLLVLVTQALRNSEPVLLVGETGCGKTTLCQAVAQLAGKKLHIINAHQNLETGDLIGAHRPLRDRDLITGRLRSLLHEIFRSNSLHDIEEGDDLDNMIRHYDRLVLSGSVAVPIEVNENIMDLRSQVKSLFEWSDGSIVTAMKQGDYMLLDEIALADDSVLERLNSVLEPGRSLYLAEKGTVDSGVTASPGFQFLATMNPGGDYGKRELSKALRNRFTEIWVPTLVAAEELEEIVKAKLKRGKAYLAKQMIEFAFWFTSEYSSPSTKASIRDLLTWTDFVEACDYLELTQALYNGASMAYIDRLGASPASIVVTHGLDIERARRTCISMLETLFGLDINSASQHPLTMTESTSEFRIGHFALVKMKQGMRCSTFNFRAPTIKQNAMKIMRALQLSKPILLEGDPGVGKTSLIAALAEKSGRNLVRINLSDQTDLMDLFGSDVPTDGSEFGKFEWRDAAFLAAMRSGDWVLLDEMNLASQSVLEGLNACFDHRGEVFISELSRTFPKHPEFAAFAAQNPHHRGAGRKGLPKSFVDRFTVVYADVLTSDDVMTICTDRDTHVGLAAISNIVNCVQRVGHFVSKSSARPSTGSPWEFNLRDVIRWLQLLSAERDESGLVQPLHYASTLLARRFRQKEDRRSVNSEIEEAFQQRLPEREVHVTRTMQELQVGLGRQKIGNSTAVQENGYQAHAQPLTLMESTLLCVEMSWPILLVGTSQQDKTKFLNCLSDLTGSTALRVSLHPSMDAQDFLGGFEQFDAQQPYLRFRRKLDEYTRQTLLEQSCLNKETLSKLVSLLYSDNDIHKSTDIVETLRSVCVDLPQSLFPSLLDEMNCIERRDAQTDSARFVWNDGILLRAVKQGKWLILDNANLCDASVLDRLNSLLESQGVIVVNEHRSSEHVADIVEPHPSFRIFLTMDPRHGELSQAMRNRCVEIFMPTEAEIPRAICPALDVAFEAENSRFASFQTYKLDEQDESLWTPLISIALDHLNLADLNRLKGWHSQIKENLLPVGHEFSARITPVVRAYLELTSSTSQLIQHISHIYNSASSRDVQIVGIHPFNNLSLQSIEPSHPGKDMLSLGRLFELQLQASVLANEVKTSSSVGLQRPFHERTLLQKSFQPENLPSTTSTVWFSLLHDLPQSLENLQKFVDEMSVESEIKESALNFCKRVLYFLRDVIDETDKVHPSNGKLIFIASQCQALLSDKAALESSEVFNLLQRQKPLIEWIRNIRSTCMIKSGFAMSELWHYLRPRMPRSQEQSDVTSRIWQCVHRFDHMKFKGGEDLATIAHVHDNLMLFLKLCFANEQLPDDLDKILEASNSLHSEFFQDTTGPTATFDSEFRILRQYESCQQAASLGLDHQLFLLSGQSSRGWFAETSGDSDNLSVIKRFLSSIGSVSLGTRLDILRKSLPIQAFRHINTLPGVSLRSLPLLKIELQKLTQSVVSMSGIISSNHLQIIARQLQDVQQCISKSVQSLASALKVEDLKQTVDDLRRRVSGELGEVGGLPILHNDSKVSEYLMDCIGTILPVGSQPVESFDEPQSTIELASSIIRLFTGCLLLFVPDQPFDPLEQAKFGQERSLKRRSELQAQFEALKYFETKDSGQCNSGRLHIIDADIRACGSVEAERVWRRPSARIESLSGTFDFILRTIILQPPTMERKHVVLVDKQEHVAALERLREATQDTMDRISLGDFGLDDVEQPLSVFLSGLHGGLSMALCAYYTEVEDPRCMACLNLRTPLMGDGCRRMHQTVASAEDPPTESGIDNCISLLEFSALEKILKTPSSAKSSEEILESFHRCYNAWKLRLEHDQNTLAKKRSLYQYRDLEAENDEDVLARELAKLFSEENQEQSHRAPQPDRSNDMQRLATRLASLQRQIFIPDADPSQQMLALMRYSASRIPQLWSFESSYATFPCQASDMLPALVLRLDDELEKLEPPSSDTKIPSFYQSPNIQEAQKLIETVTQVRLRFKTLHQAWPDHATIREVLSVCDSALQMSHAEPLARLITKLEQIHSFVSQWQTIASLEFSAAAQQDTVIRLIISWRRLELKTWESLLEAEDQACKADAQNWWFVAYESIIAVPLSPDFDEASMDSFGFGLLETLSKFISTTLVGQYESRMSLLANFLQHIRFISISRPSMVPIVDALGNFLRYYARYIPRVSEHLASGRARVEKGLKETILLASWKDTNILTLRESARRSHHKLFTLIRDYREVLATPVDGLLDRTDLPVPQRRIATTSSFRYSDPDVSALITCQNAVDIWEQMPERLRDPALTASRMQRICQMHQHLLNVDSTLDDVTQNLRDEVHALQSLTNGDVASQSIAEIKNITSRKRQLLSEAMRMLRSLGFQSSISQDLLDKQKTLARLLAQLPAITYHSEDSACQESDGIDALFESILDMRTLAKTPHSDLGNTVVAKAAGYLESMLATVVEQRKAISRTTLDVQCLESCLEVLQALFKPHEYQVQSRDGSITDLERRLRWLPPVIQTVRYLIQRCERYTASDSAELLAVLEDMERDFIELARRMEELPKLPVGLITTKHHQILQKTSQKMLAADLTLQDLGSTWPKSRFFLQQIAYWVEPETAQQDRHQTTRKAYDASQITSRLRQIADDILLSTQSISKTLESQPETIPDIKWFSNADNVYRKCLDKSTVRDIPNILKLWIRDLGSIDASDSSQIDIVAALSHMILPIVQQYHAVLDSMVSKYASFHDSTIHLALFCTRALARVFKDGFCVPQDKEEIRNDNKEKIEEGTGLGEGSGLEDISSDIGRDEDLSEMAQANANEDTNKELEGDDEAVDMQGEDLEGQLAKASEKEDVAGQEQADESTDAESIDEAVGEADRENSDVVDEKFWNADEENPQEDMDTTDSKAELDQGENAVTLNDVRNDRQGSNENDDVDEITSEVSSEEVSSVGNDLNRNQEQAGEALDTATDFDLGHIDPSESQSAADEDDTANLSNLSSDHAMSDVETNPDQGDRSPSRNTDDSDFLEEDGGDGKLVKPPTSSSPSPDRDISPDSATRQAALGEQDVDTSGHNEMEAAYAPDTANKNEPESIAASETQVTAGQQSTLANDDSVLPDGNDNDVFDKDAQDLEAADPDTKGEHTSLKQLGDALEKWHRLHRPLQQASHADDGLEDGPKSPEALRDQFEHVEPDAQEYDTQALGGTDSDGAKPLDAQARAAEAQDLSSDGQNNEIDDKNNFHARDHADKRSMREAGVDHEAQTEAPTLVTMQSDQQSIGEAEPHSVEEDVEMLDASSDGQSTVGPVASRPTLEQAHLQWQSHENSTHHLAIGLTEELRLILQPTQAAKMRGDFRTGKRLNLKRIIPYIASGYKRDKIWLRRSAPSKRNYQVLIAVDDSRSMEDSDNIALTFQALALITRSLTMLEAGQVCVVGFGDKISVAHDFGQPFSSEAGARLCRELTFLQDETRVDRLISQSVDMLEQARRKQFNMSGDTWQLQLIISDGNFHDHELVRRQVRRGQEAKIMIVFIIVDSLNRGGSILATKKVEWETSQSGSKEMKIKYYLDQFPFPYYLIVSHVEDLPGVLAEALKQWFIEVAESSQ